MHIAILAAIGAWLAAHVSRASKNHPLNVAAAKRAAAPAAVPAMQSALSEPATGESLDSVSTTAELTAQHPFDALVAGEPDEMEPVPLSTALQAATGSPAPAAVAETHDTPETSLQAQQVCCPGGPLNAAAHAGAALSRAVSRRPAPGRPAPARRPAPGRRPAPRRFFRWEV